MTWLVLSIVISFAGSVALYLVFDSPVFFGFLFLPFLPFAFGAGRRSSENQATAAVRTCPRCAFQSADAETRFCPRDGSGLV